LAGHCVGRHIAWPGAAVWRWAGDLLVLLGWSWGLAVLVRLRDLG
jgi:hypothetical protein